MSLTLAQQEKDRRVRLIGFIPHTGVVRELPVERDDLDPPNPRMEKTFSRLQGISAFKPDKPGGKHVPMPNEGPNHKWPTFENGERVF